MKCPICKQPVQIGMPDFPFCSERCRLIDLGNWATEKYVISTPIQPGDRPDAPNDEEDDR
ncbi:MAG TPA: DNA gyrase inhibitor YacG [Bryobacteraceae bacterium]|nr:DNA gyrase inhibitor YacG [Bryobacteraceae bacterium]